jgi:multiple sugar transport system permease protein
LTGSALKHLSRLARLSLRAAAIAVTAFSFIWVGTRPLRSEPRQAGQVTLTVLHWGDKEEDRIVADLVAAFERENPHIRVIRTNTGSPAQLATKLQTMLASGDPPDLFYLPFEKVAAIGSLDVLENLDPYIERDRAAGLPDAPDLEDFFPATLAAFRYDPATGRVGTGPLVGLPKDFTCVGFYYNKKLFDQAGLPYPPREGWTWDEFIAAARAIGRLQNCYGAEFVTWESIIRIYLYTHGLDVASPGFHSFRLTEPHVVAAIEKLRDWFFNDEPRTLLSAKTQLETGQAPFLSGRIGLAGPFGRWQVPLCRTITDFDWDFAPLPHADGQPPCNGVLTVAWAMAKRSQHKEHAWRLMKFLLGREGQELVCRTGLAIPARKSVAYSECFTDPTLKPDHDEVFLDQALVSQPIEWPADPRYMDELKTGLENIFKLGRPARQELERLQRTWEQLAAYTAPRPPMPWRKLVWAITVGLVLLSGPLAILWWRHRPGRLAQREELAGLALASPWMIGFAIFCAFPIGLSLLLSLARWNAMRSLEFAEWVGADNFRELLSFDPTFRKALRVTGFYALLAVPSSQIVALAAAVLLNREFRGIRTFRAIWYLPSVLAGVGMAIMWKWVFHHEHGLLNALLQPLCDFWNAHFVAGSPLNPPRWFERDAERWGVPAFAIINLWLIGGPMMIYLAGLKGIPRELYEAAAIDGASGWQRFRAVTLPMLSPVIFFNSIMALIGSFQLFTPVFVMTGGGPGTATHFYVFYLYKKAFDLGEMGYASAMAWLLLLLILALTLLIMRGTQRLIYYEALRT